MAIPTGYRAPAEAARAEIKERGSKFLALIEPVSSVQEARDRLAEIVAAHPDASHHCWARRLGDPPLERSSDAGEPNGTAGRPILQVLRGAGVSDVLAVVVRWFGGTKLGKGGLARAYAGTAREAVAALETVERVPTVVLELELSYDRVGAVKRLIHPPEVELRSESYGEVVSLTVEVYRHELEQLCDALAELRVEVREQLPSSGSRSD